MNIKMSEKGHSRAEQRARQPEVEERCIHRLYPEIAVNRFTMAKRPRRVQVAGVVVPVHNA